MNLLGPLRRPLWLATAVSEGVLEVALTVVRETKAALEQVSAEPQAPRPPEPVRVPVAEPPPRPARPKPEPPPVPEAAPPPPISDKVKTMDDAPVPVGEFGEEGAEEAPGAEIHVDEPWEGYDGLTAAQVKQRLQREAGSETLAAVVLYEGLGKKRSSVIDAAERQLRRSTAPGS